MKSPKVHIFILFGIFTLLLNQPQLCIAYSLIGSQLLDLQSNDLTTFKSEVSSWTASTQKSANKYTLCGTIYILGGPNVLGHDTGQYFERTYTGLPSHTQINYSIVFWSIDSWSSSDSFDLKFDSTTISGWSLIQRGGLSNICGDTYADLPSVRIDGTVAHSDTQLVFRAISRLTQPTNILSFGIRDIQLNFVSPTSPVDSTPCAASPITLPNTIPTCSCPAGKYETLTHSGNCVSCHPTCATCTGGSDTSCTSCPMGRFLKGTQCLGCDVSCGTCNGISADNCLTCASGYKKVPGTGGSISCILESAGEQSFLYAPTMPNTATFIVLSKTTQYVRYLNMNMSPRLQQLAASRGREILSLRFGFNMPASMQEKFSNIPLSPPFDRQNYHSSFIVNYWLELTSLGVILAAGFIFIIFELCFQGSKWENLKKGLQVFRILTAWNFCFLLLATSLGDIIIFSYLEYSTISSVTSPSAVTSFSVVVSVLAIIILFVFLAGIFFLVRKTYAYKRGLMKGEITHLSMIRWDGSRVLYDGFYTRRLVSRLFFLIYTVRLCLPLLIAIAIQSSAIANTMLQIIINVGILVILLRFKPLKARINQIQLILFESITLIINFFVLILAILDASKSEATDAMVGIGDFIIVLSFILNVLVIIFLAIKLFLAAKHIRSQAKEQSKHEIFISCLRLLEIPMQLGGMGFEQTFEDLTLQDDDYEEEVPSPDKISPTVLFEAQSSCGLTIRASIARNLDEEDPKSTALMTSNMCLVPSLVNNLPKGDLTERQESEPDSATSRKQPEEPTSNLLSVTEAPKEAMEALSIATVRPMERSKKRVKSVPKNKPNPEDDKFYMYKEKFNQPPAQAPKKKKKSKKSIASPNQ